jgi:exonuclease SbcC
MVTRIKSLTVENFRLLRGVHEFDFDADVVLVHGNNGTGKSSLLYAIEFALTGGVHDLKAFSSDYPRCLQSVGTSSTAVTIVVEENGKAIVSSAKLALEKISHAKAEIKDVNSFAERCFLSQCKLSRLLDVYREVDSKSSETPIARFVKALVDFDALDNLAIALHDFEDKRRIAKAYPQITEIEGLDFRLKQNLSELSGRMKEVDDDINRTISVAEKQVDLLGRSIRTDEWSMASVTALRETLSKDSQSNQMSDEQNFLLKAQLQIKASATLLKTVDQDLPSTISAGEKTILAVTLEIEELTREISPVLTSIAAELKKLPATQIQLDSNQSVVETVQGMRKSIEGFLKQSQQQLLLRKQLSDERQVADAQLAERRADLEQNRDSQLAVAAKLPNHIGLLTEALKVLEGNECPVCLRDFSERGGESLSEFVRGRIRTLTTESMQLKALSDRASELDGQIKTLEGKVKSVEQREKELDSVEVHERNQTIVGALSASLEGIRERVARLQEAQRELSKAQAAVDTARKILNQIASIDPMLKETAKSLGIADLGEDDTGKLVEILETNVSNRLEAISQKRKSLESVQNVLLELTNLYQKRQKLDKDWILLNQRLKGISDALLQIESTISKSKRVLKASVEVKRKLLRRIFDDKLNTLWSDLFGRLVPEEVFKPKLSEPESSRDRIKTGMKAVTDGVRAFDNLAAIFSLGNLNTAALSLFLSLNLVQKDGNRVIVLDDPVQSMDDIHISQLSLLLRELVNQAGRQIIVAIHERPLFEFLAFELAPAQSGRRLVTIDLSRTVDNTGAISQVVSHSWEEDEVEIQLEATRTAS